MEQKKFQWRCIQKCMICLLGTIYSIKLCYRDCSLVCAVPCSHNYSWCWKWFPCTSTHACTRSGMFSLTHSNRPGCIRTVSKAAYICCSSVSTSGMGTAYTTPLIWYHNQKSHWMRSVNKQAMLLDLPNRSIGQGRHDWDASRQQQRSGLKHHHVAAT